MVKFIIPAFIALFLPHCLNPISMGMSTAFFGMKKSLPFPQTSSALEEDQIPVPYLMDMELDDVVKIIEVLDLNYEILEYVDDSGEAEGTILSQEPEVGTIVNRGRTIFFTIAK